MCVVMLHITFDASTSSLTKPVYTLQEHHEPPTIVADGPHDTHTHIHFSPSSNQQKPTGRRGFKRELAVEISLAIFQGFHLKALPLVNSVSILTNPWEQLGGIGWDQYSAPLSHVLSALSFLFIRVSQQYLCPSQLVVISLSYELCFTNVFPSLSFLCQKIMHLTARGQNLGKEFCCRLVKSLNDICPFLTNFKG